jgi:hypothetical protein
MVTVGDYLASGSLGLFILDDGPAVGDVLSVVSLGLWQGTPDIVSAGEAADGRNLALTLFTGAVFSRHLYEGTSVSITLYTGQVESRNEYTR